MDSETVSTSKPAKKRKPRAHSDNVSTYNSCIDNSQLGRLYVGKAEFVYDIARLKAERSLYMAFGVGTRMLDCLMHIDTILKVTDRQGMDAATIVSSSGRSRKWKSEMWSAMAQNVAAGTIEKNKRNSYSITQKGRTVLNTFSAKRAAIARDIVENPSVRWFGHIVRRAA